MVSGTVLLIRLDGSEPALSVTHLGVGNERLN